METEIARLFINDFIVNLPFSNSAFQLMPYTTMSMYLLSLNYMGKCTFMGQSITSPSFLPKNTSLHSESLEGRDLISFILVYAVSSMVH